MGARADNQLVVKVMLIWGIVTSPFFMYLLAKCRACSSVSIVTTTQAPVVLAPTFLDCLQTPENRDQMQTYYQLGGDEAFQMKLDYLTPKSVVFDIGGNKGGFVARATHTRLHVFEPLPVLVTHLRTHFPTVQVHPYGIASKSGTIRLAVEGEQMSATSQFTESGAPVETVPVRTLREAMQDAQVQYIDLVNINCEGCEFNIVESILEDALVCNITHLQVQFHPQLVPGGTARRCRIRQMLAQTHVETYNIAWIWERWTLRAPCGAQ